MTPHAPTYRTVRLALADSRLGRPSDRTLAAPTVRLAHAPGAQGDNALSGERGVAALPQTSAPALLISFVYLEPFLQKRARFVYRDWALDSGAYSASTLGITIDLEQYIETCRELMATDPTLTDIFALDVIGDWRASLRNTERMWRAGVPAIPAFHNGEPEDVLRGLARDYPKIALGGAVGMAAKDEWAAQCFARVWPKKIHGFSFGGEKSLLRFPWHSVDATNWELGPCKFGRWRAFKGAVSVRGSRQNLRAEVEYYLKLEQRMRRRWVKEMAKLASLPPVTPPFLGEPGMETTHAPRVETTPRRSRRKGSR